MKKQPWLSRRFRCRICMQAVKVYVRTKTHDLCTWPLPLLLVNPDITSPLFCLLFHSRSSTDTPIWPEILFAWHDSYYCPYPSFWSVILDSGMVRYKHKICHRFKNCLHPNLSFDRFTFWEMLVTASWARHRLILLTRYIHRLDKVMSCLFWSTVTEGALSYT